MREILLTLILLISITGGAFASPAECPIIPLPSSVVKENGVLPLAALKHIFVSNPELAPVARFLQTEALKHSGITLTLSTATRGGAAIGLVMVRNGKMSAEAYSLNISSSGIRIEAATAHGAFNGVVSLLQLIRLASVHPEKKSLAYWQISDEPQMRWRGVMLDESRHFFGMEKVKMILDWMAFYKLNRFHWHLTDAPGWRVEIKSFPKLTLIGGIGTHTDALAPASYYSQEEIKEIVRYAGERFIEVVPEIDMPGHATAANRAYPEYSGGGSEKYPEFTFNPGKEGTYDYLSKVIKEIDVLFPSKMIHLGGDEVHFGNAQWNTNDDVRQLMRKNSLADLRAVEAYFIERMADSIIQLNAKVLGWDEISSTQIAPENTIIFWWRHNKPETLKESIDKGYQVVLCPRIPFYFDFVQDSTHILGRRWAGAFADLKTVYDYHYSQYSNIIGRRRENQVAGIQANLWTEQIVSPARLEYMLFPRITGLAEAAWTKPQDRDFNKYMQRLDDHEVLFKKAGLRYYDAGTPSTTPEVVD